MPYIINDIGLNAFSKKTLIFTTASTTIQSKFLLPKKTCVEKHCCLKTGLCSF